MPASIHCFAITAPGLEDLCAGELRNLNVRGEVVAGGVEWEGDHASLYRANLHLRTASRVVVRVARFRARSFIELERHLGRIDWSPHLVAGARVQLRVSSARSRLYHERAIAERVQRMLSDRIGAVVDDRGSGRGVGEPGGHDDDEGTSRPSARGHVAGGGSGPRRTAERSARGDEDPDASAAGTPPRMKPGDDARGSAVVSEPLDAEDAAGGDAQLIIVRFHRDECTISMDASGALLHRRGYRLEVARAPLRETIAAAMILAVGWDPRAPLLDPFCGSGTIPIEAGLIAGGIPPGLAAPDRIPRSFALTGWPTFEPGVWERVVGEARAGIRDAEPTIRGSDRDEGAIAAARANASRAGMKGVEFDVAPLTRVVPPAGEGWLVTNPPYGLRVGERKRLADLYAAFGNWARSSLRGWSVAMLAADAHLPRQARLTWEERIRTVNGGVPVKLLTASVSPPAAPSPATP